MNAVKLAREAIQNLIPYSSARNECSLDGIHLDANENPFWREDELNRYPNPQPPLLRQKLAEFYGVEASQLLMTRGSDEGIDLLIRVFCEPKIDSIVITPPTYGMYEVAANIQGTNIIKVPLRQKQEFSLAKEKILELKKASLKLIFLCSPSNPLGNLLNKDEIFALCEEFKDQALIVVDEAYIEFSTTESLVTNINDYPNLLILRTFSKAFGLAGLRLGSVIANPTIIQLLAKTLAPYPIARPVELLALAALSQVNLKLVVSQIAIIREERELLKQFLCSLPSVDFVYPSETNFLLVKVKDATRWMQHCKEQQIIIRSRSEIPELFSCVRITIGTTEEIERLKKVLRNV